MASGKQRKESKKRSGSEKRKTCKPLSVRLTEQERAQIKAAADREALTVGSYVRSRALEKPTTRAVHRAPVATAQLAQLLGLLGAAGGDLQRITQRLDDGAYICGAEMKAALDAFRAAASAIMGALGKRPHDH
jgi:hypothetical protein